MTHRATSEGGFRSRRPGGSCRPGALLGALFGALFVALLATGCGGEGDAPPRGTAGVATPPPLPRVPDRFAYESADDLPPATPLLHDQINILLITCDTVRRDRLDCYGAERGTSPQLVALAAEALLFEDCQASVPVTLPSHVSIITGREPYEHGVRNNATYVLGDDAVTLAEVLGAAGYATGGVMAAFVLERRYGTAQGFDHFDDAFVGGVAGSPVPQRIAGEVSQLGLDWIKSHRDEPWFVWLHYFDPHDPYSPPAPFDTRFADHYDGELAYMDAHLGGLFRELRRCGLWEQTLIVVVADHGEGLGDHDEPSHSHFIYRTTIDAPLLIKFPRNGTWSAPRFHARRLDGLVATTDIMPTILDVAGIPRDAWPVMSGVSLLPLISEGRPVREHAYMETLVPELDYGWAPYRGLRQGPWKYIQAPIPELYNLDRDPDELHNVCADESERATAMEARLRELVAADHEAAGIALDQATVERLRSLGYVAGGGSRADYPQRDTKEMAWALRALDRTRALMKTRRVEAAMDTLREVLQRDPTNRYAQRLLAQLLLRAGEGSAAAQICEQILREQPGAADVAIVELQLAEAALLQGQPQAALDACRRLHRDNPRQEGTRLLSGRALAALGRYEEAHAEITAEIEAFPPNPVAAATLGKIYLDAGRIAEAAAVYHSALERSPGHADLLGGQARLLLMTGRTAEAQQHVQAILSVDPTHSEANYLAGLLLNQSRRPAEAMQRVLQATLGEPGNAEYQATLGTLLVRGRNFEKGVIHLEKALRLGRREQPMLAALGAAYQALGHRDRAREILQEALEIAPDGPFAPQIRQQLSQFD